MSDKYSASNWMFYFEAPKPAITKATDYVIPQGGNFQWLNIDFSFKDIDGASYIYPVKLGPTGVRLDFKEKVLKNGGGKFVAIDAIKPDDVESEFPNIRKFDIKKSFNDLHDKASVVYVNKHQSDKNKEYTPGLFIENFVKPVHKSDGSFDIRYILMGSDKRMNPLNTLKGLGSKGTPAEESEEKQVKEASMNEYMLFRQAVRNAKEKKTGPVKGGFSILQDWVKEQRQKQQTDVKGASIRHLYATLILAATLNKDLLKKIVDTLAGISEDKECFLDKTSLILSPKGMSSLNSIPGGYSADFKKRGNLKQCMLLLRNYIKLASNVLIDQEGNKDSLMSHVYSELEKKVDFINFLKSSENGYYEGIVHIKNGLDSITDSIGNYQVPKEKRDDSTKGIELSQELVKTYPEKYFPEEVLKTA